MVNKVINIQSQQGYVAITSVIIFSALLLLLTVALSEINYSARFLGLERHLKFQSRLLADACVSMALLRLHQTNSYSGNEKVYITRQDACQILSVTPAGIGLLIPVEAAYKAAYTNLSITVNPNSDYSLLSWQEN